MVRNVVTRSAPRLVGYHVSRKSGMLVPWESQIEQDYFQWLEVDPRILRFKSQPRTFKWSDFRYTPDALVTTDGGSFFAEVKPDKALDDLETRVRLEEIERRLLSENCDFRIVLESTIRQQPMRRNVIELNRLTRFNLSNDEWSRLADYTGPWPASLGQLEAELGQGARRLVLRFVARGELLLDLTQEITSNSLLTLPSCKENRHGPFQH